MASFRRHPVSTLAGVACALVVVIALDYLGMPLAWLLGSLMATAALSLAGFEINPPKALRNVGQVTIGATAGLNITSEILVMLLGWFPLMVVSALFCIVASAAVSVLFSIWAKVDTKSSYFASLPGGLAEMANVGVQVGADPEPIAVVQTLRAALIAILVPLVLFQFGVSRDPGRMAIPDIALVWTPVLLIGGGALAYVLGLLRLNNPWMIGGTLCAAIFSASGLVEGHMPQPVFQVAQFFIGVAVGSRFRPFMIRRLPRVTLCGIASVCLLGLIMISFAFVLAGLTSIDATTAILATSPGGISEMTTTAQVLHLAVSTVVAFQIVRALTVNAFAVHFWIALNWIGFFSLMKRLLGQS